MKVLKTDKSPAAIGPYSQATRTGNMIFTSGMLPIDMATGELELSCIKNATKNCLTNINNLLSVEGASLKDVVKTVVFMTDLGEFTDMNEVYSSFFTENPPARSTVQVAALPKGAKIEIEVVAVVE